MKLRLTKRFEIDAAHYLPKHTGKCRNLHGHRWVLDVTVVEDEIGLKDGMLIDFANLKEIIHENCIDIFDHRCFNETLPKEMDPTCENIALLIFKMLTDALWKYRLELEEIRLEEGPGSWVTVRKE